MKNKVIIVTGTTRGLGKVLYNRLLSTGYKVACINRSIQESESERFINVRASITKIDQVKRAVNYIYSKWGRLDVLINNAGIVSFSSIEEQLPEVIDNVIDTNIKGTFYVTQQVLSYMVNGYIITLGSTRSITPAKNKSIYTMSKFALRALNKCISIEYPNIRSTIVCPGRIEPEGQVSKEFISEKILSLIQSNKAHHIRELIIGGEL